MSSIIPFREPEDPPEESPEPHVEPEEPPEEPPEPPEEPPSWLLEPENPPDLGPLSSSSLLASLVYVFLEGSIISAGRVVESEL